MEEKEYEISPIETILQHYITKTVAIIIAVFSVFKMIILPINEIQLGLSQLQKDVALLNTSSQQIVQNQRDIDILKEQIASIREQLKIK